MPKRTLGNQSRERDARSLRPLLYLAPTPSSVTDHGSLAGLSDDDHPQYGALAQAETVTGAWVFQAGVHVDVGNLTVDEYVASDLLPSATDTYDLGSSTRLWRKGWLSELDTILFAENTVSLYGGWLMVTKNAGSLPSDVDNSQTQIDFGKSMTNGDFVLFRQSLQVEYMTVGSVVSGTTYNVTRNVDGSGANSWPAGAAFAVLGQSGDGRIELTAYDDPPHLDILEQGATYNSQTVRARLGNMRGEFGTGANDRYGFGVGDYTNENYLTFNAESAGKFILKAGDGGLTIGEYGITFDSPASLSYPVAIKWGDTGGNNDMHLAAFISSSKVWGYLDLNNAPEANGSQLTIQTRDGGGNIRALLDLISDSAEDSARLYAVDQVELETGTTGDVIINSGQVYIDQGAEDVYILNFQSSDVDHGITLLGTVTTDTFGAIGKLSATLGGLQIQAFSESAYDSSLYLHGFAGTGDTTKSTAADAPVEIQASKKDGSVSQAMGTNENVLVVSNGSNARFIVDAEGDIHYDGTANTYDEHDDLHLVRALDVERGGAIRDEFDRWLKYNRDDLQRLGLATFNENGEVFVNLSALTRLHNGAIWQLAKRVMGLEQKLLEAGFS